MRRQNAVHIAKGRAAPYDGGLGDHMIGIRKLSHACYTTADLARLTAYYVDILGLTLTAKEANTAYLSSAVEQHSVVLRAGAEPQCTGLGFQLSAEDDLESFARQTEAYGVAVSRESDPEPGITEQLRFADPKGTQIQVFKAVQSEGQRLGRNGIVPNKLGHVAFHVEDVVLITDFYCDVLGFRVSDWLERHFSFLRCGSDHHTVNFIGSGQVRHDHTAFELRDWSHIEQACDFLTRNDIRLIWGPGRHGIGHNLFTYHRNPDGHLIELYAELDQMANEHLGYFEPRPWHPDVPQRPKTWTMTPGLVNLWRYEFPPAEMLEVTRISPASNPLHNSIV